MKHLLNKEVQSIQISGIRQFADKMKIIPDVVSLTIGEPDFKTPELIKQMGKMAIDQDYTNYAPTAGLLSLRKGAADFLSRKYQLHYNHENEIIVTNGTTESIFLSLKAIINPGDEILIPTPTYPGYEPIINMSYGKLVYMDVSKNGFKLTKDVLKQYITPKTKALILPYPSNPTGVTLSKEELKELADELVHHEIFIISDELYSELVFEKEHASIASFDTLRDRTIVINGVSKSHAMTGWRVGFIFAPPYITKEMMKVHQYVNTSVNTMAQAAAVHALYSGDTDTLKMKEEYKKRRDYLFHSLTDLRFDVLLPESTFYMFPSTKPFGMNSYDFSLDVLEKAKVGILPSRVFTGGGDEHLRISFAYSMEKLEECMKRLHKYLK